MVQYTGAQCIQLCTQRRPIGLFQQLAQEMVVAYAGAALVERALHIIVGAGADKAELVAMLDKQLLHAQLQLGDHPGIGGLGSRAGEQGIVQPLAAKFHRLFQAALQQAQAQGQLGVAGRALLPPGPEVQLGAAVAQPGAAQGVQLLGGVRRGVQLGQHIGEQVKVRHLLCGDSAQVVVEIQIQAACRGVPQQGGTGQLLPGTLRRGIPLAQVCGGKGMLQHQFAIGAHRGGGILGLGGGGHLQHLYRGGGKQLPQQGIEPACCQLAAQGGKQFIGVQQQGGIAGMEPAGGSIDGVQHAVRQAARALQRCKLCGVQGGEQQLLRDAFFQDVVHSPAHSGGKLTGRIHRGTAQQQLQRRLQGAVVKADVDIGTQLFGQQGGLKGGAVGAEQGIQQNLHAQLPLPVSKGTGVPGQCALHLIRLGLRGVVGQLHSCAGLLVLQGQAGAGGGFGHPGEVVPVQLRQFFGHIHPAIQGDAAVVGAVVAAVHPLVFFIGQGRDGGRVAAGHKAVGGIREHCTLQRVLQLGIRGGQRTLHLVVDHAAYGAVCIPVPALLLKHGRVHHGQRAEHRIQVDIHQVAEVGLVGGGKGVDRFVREGHRVEEGGHAAFEQLHEGGADRVFFAAGQHGMLQDMEYAGVIGGKGAETDAERLVDILVFHQQHGGTAAVVGEHGQGAVLLGAVLGAQDGIAGIMCHFSDLLCGTFLQINACRYCGISRRTGRKSWCGSHPG